MNILFTISSLPAFIKTQKAQNSLVYKIGFAIALSWIYAACSQIIIPLPFNMVPLSIQPLPLIFCAETFGWPAISAYLLYLMQGALGAPFFSHFGCGLPHLLGPTGGYLIGFLIAMTITKLVKTQTPNGQFLRYWLASISYFCFGLCQLALFVPSSKLFVLGFYPFLIGDFIIKPLLFITLTKQNRKM